MYEIVYSETSSLHFDLWDFSDSQVQGGRAWWQRRVCFHLGKGAAWIWALACWESGQMLGNLRSDLRIWLGARKNNYQGRSPQRKEFGFKNKKSLEFSRSCSTDGLPSQQLCVHLALEVNDRSLLTGLICWIISAVCLKKSLSLFQCHSLDLPVLWILPRGISFWLALNWPMSLDISLERGNQSTATFCFCLLLKRCWNPQLSILGDQVQVALLWDMA